MLKIPKTYFILLLLLAVGLTLFQNCGQSGFRSSRERISYRSPFYEQRVRLDKPSEESLELAKDQVNFKQEEILILLDNSCSIEACNFATDGADALSCQILNEKPMEGELQDSLQAYAWNVDPNESSISFEQKIASNSVDDQCIVGVSHNLTYKTQATTYPTNDPDVLNEYHHRTINGNDAYSFFYAQNLPTVKVGVVDSGTEAHENLLAINTPIGAAKCDEPPCHWHGNFVSNIISGRHNNGKGGHGIAPNAQVWSYQIGDSLGQLTSEDIINAIQRARLHAVEIINLSLGGSALIDYVVQDAIINSITDGIIIVVAGGNNGQNLDNAPFYPASFNFDGQINVGSASPQLINSSDGAPYSESELTSPIKRDAYSNYSSGLVHISAPGRNIYSALLDNTYGVASGTSFSAPMVSGALALIIGHLKAHDIGHSPRIVRQLLFEGSRSVSSLRENGDSVFAQDRFLDLAKLKTSLEGLDSIAGQDNIGVISSESQTVDGQKEVIVRVEVRDLDPTQGFTLKAYTNQAFLTESFTGYECQILSARQFCDVVVSYTQLLIDPELYLAIYDSTGRLITDLSIPKTALNFGDKSVSQIKGEITYVEHFDHYFRVTGWACLVGFPDAVDIEVRLNSSTNNVYQTIITNRQGQGDYFEVCDSPEISHGFRYTVPKSLVENSSEYKLFFRAVHPETSKTLNLKVYEYQPGYNDNTPATFRDHVVIDRNLAGNKLDVNITNRSFDNYVLTLEGTACFTDSNRPAMLKLNLGSPKLRYLFKSLPELYSHLPEDLFTTVESNIQENISIDSIYRRIKVPNDQYIPLLRDDLGSLSLTPLGFSEVHQRRQIYLSGKPSEKFLVPLRDIINLSSRSPGGFVVIRPIIEKNDGCPVPSGFEFSIDLRKYVREISSYAGLAYRSDIYSSPQEVLNRPSLQPFKPFFDLTDSFSTNMDNMIFSSKMFRLSLKNTTATAVFYPYMDFDSGFSFNLVNYHIGKSSVSPPAKGWIDFDQSQYLTQKYWHEPLDIDLNLSPATALSTLYLSEFVSVNRSADSLFTFLFYEEGMKLGNLNEDLRLQVRFGPTGKWFDLRMFVGNHSSSTGKGWLLVDGDFVNKTSQQVQFRILANGKSDLTLKSFGFVVE